MIALVLILVLLPFALGSASFAAPGVPARPVATRVFVEDFSPNWSPDGSQLVFARVRAVIDRRNGECCLVLGSSLYVVDANGRGLRRIPGSGHDADPAWSPDGRSIAFIRRDRLYVMRPGGGGARPLRGDFLRHASPAWSPDGHEIAFWRGGQRGGIYAIRTDGTGLRRIVATADPYGGPSWSSDGRRLAFGRNLEIYVVNSDGSDPHRLTGGRHHAYYEPAWSPDGRRLVFRGDFGVYVMRADGTGIRRITRAPHELAQDTHPVWSPGGQRIAFAGYRGGAEEARLFVVAPNGRGLRRITSPPRN
jgi:Tol biopolymer transport system component